MALDEAEMHHRMHKWYNSPECDALRAAWGAYPAAPGALQAWPGFVAVTNAFLDYEAAHGRSGEPVAAEAEESEPVGASDVVPEVVEREVEEGVVTEQPGAASDERSWFSSRREAGSGTAEQTAVASIEFLGRWHENNDDPAMPVKLKKSKRDSHRGARIAFGRLVDELMQKNAPSGILAISGWNVTGFSWSASPDDTSYQRHGFIGMKSSQRQNIRFPDFDGAIDVFGGPGDNKIAVYRVTLPSRGLDADKWVGRPPPLAPEDLHTGPRDDGLLSTGEISGEYFSMFQLFRCYNSMTVMARGPDVIETWRSGVMCAPWLAVIGPMAEAAVLTRKPGTNKFGEETFWADGRVTETNTEHGEMIQYRKRPHSRKRAFRKVETRDLAGTWCGCCCSPCIPLWPLSCFYWTRKKALDEDRYAESGLRCGLCPWWSICSETYTRTYHDGGGGRSYPTNGFGLEDEITCIEGGCCPIASTYYRNSGYAAGGCLFAKKCG